MPIAGRKEEQKQLRAYSDSRHPEFLVVYGRRRVGKTYLIREVFRDRFCFHYTGRYGATMKTQLESFKAALDAHSAKKYPAPRNWTKALEYLAELIEASPFEGKKIVFLDELPWMDTPKSGFLSAFEHFWNGWGAGRNDLLLIACGSATTWLTEKVFQNKGGLFNRVTRRMHLAPFSLGECADYFQSEGFQFTRQQVLESHMVFGGIPFYMSLMDSSLSFDQNVDSLCFAENAMLKGEFDILYSTLFNQQGKHVAVVKALSGKACGLTRDELIAASGISNGGGLTQILNDLELSSFIRGYQAFAKKQKLMLWQLIDPFSFFYLKFMYENRSGDAHFWSGFSGKGGHSAWSGYAFELVCLLHAEQIKQSLGIDRINTSISTWRSEPGEDGAQIDLVIDRADKTINLCEMKYSKDYFTIDRQCDEALRRKRSAFAAATKTRKALHQTIVTTYGLTQNAYSGNVQSVITMDDLWTSHSFYGENNMRHIRKSLAQLNAGQGVEHDID
jgi:hypothetical protein